MFIHIFTTRFKCIVRDRQTMFWTLLFPIILGTMFHFALANIESSYNFQKSDIAVVNNTEYQGDSNFRTALSDVTGKSKAAGSQDLFNVTYCNETSAEELLKNDKIIGYVDFDNGPKMVVKESGFGQTILNEFLNQYLQTSAAVTTIAKTNPAALSTLDISGGGNYLKEVSPNKTKPDTTLNYFYALIGMACLYGGMFGMKEVSAIQANQTAQGARVNLAPVHKMKIFVYSLCAATAVQLIAVLVLILYLALVLGVNFGGKLPFILLACLASCLTGVSMGAMIASLTKKGEGIKMAVLITSTMTLSFLSGLMSSDVKYLVQTGAPVIAYLNPANAITDAFYSLYYYDTYTRFFTNIALLLGFTAVFYLIVYFKLRRQRYESI
jgi:ABC-2 type transport system permease protein